MTVIQHHICLKFRHMSCCFTVPEINYIIKMLQEVQNVSRATLVFVAVDN